MRSQWIIGMAFLLMLAGPSWAAEWMQESPGQRAYYDAKGNLERVELDVDRDGRFEVEERYAKRRLSRKEDRDGDGIWERSFSWNKDGSAVLVEDRGKGPVQKTFYGPAGAVRRVEKDADRNGRFEAAWLYRKGVLEKVVKPGGTWFYSDGKLARAELDENRDGSPEKREHYRDGRLERTEELTPKGKVRCLWTFDQRGKPLRAEEDADGDGRREVRREYRPDGTIVRTLDADGDGVTEVRERFNAEGRLVSREEDLNGDGVFDLRTGRITGKGEK